MTRTSRPGMASDKSEERSHGSKLGRRKRGGGAHAKEELAAENMEDSHFERCYRAVERMGRRASRHVVMMEVAMEVYRYCDAGFFVRGRVAKFWMTIEV